MNFTVSKNERFLFDLCLLSYMSIPNQAFYKSDANVISGLSDPKLSGLREYFKNEIFKGAEINVKASEKLPSTYIMYLGEVDGQQVGMFMGIYSDDSVSELYVSLSDPETSRFLAACERIESLDDHFNWSKEVAT